ncbi:hypothetical protein RM844_17175 [Streptomyces sp. DSM 44915]|uniref:Integral membrane protein n=1 Tax=Streptomyces chisholmiae TaxID=3075540 RepID=A0ABU2JSP7_9ACTN|nr:hypothetical protein [Streptomyces sp. DSM 44915]MDT0268015.1 hypothetical protein [Streptomyces sp. DSM 44915]
MTEPSHPLPPPAGADRVPGSRPGQASTARLRAVRPRPGGDGAGAAGRPAGSTGSTGPVGAAGVAVSTAGTLPGETLWRVLVIACAFIGYHSTGGATLYGLSQLASVAAGFGYALILVVTLAAVALRRPEPPTTWLRGLLTVTLLLVMVTWFTVLDGDVHDAWSLFEHLLTPLAVLVDWLFVGRRQALASWWYPLSWAAVLLVYLVVYLASDAALYPFLDSGNDGFPAAVAGLGALTLALGFALVALARARGGGATRGA